MVRNASCNLGLHFKFDFCCRAVKPEIFLVLPSATPYFVMLVLFDQLFKLDSVKGYLWKALMYSAVLMHQISNLKQWSEIYPCITVITVTASLSASIMLYWYGSCNQQDGECDPYAPVPKTLLYFATWISSAHRNKTEAGRIRPNRAAQAYLPVFSPKCQMLPSVISLKGNKKEWTSFELCYDDIWLRPHYNNVKKPDVLLVFYMCSCWVIEIEALQRRLPSPPNKWLCLYFLLLCLL